MKSLAMLVVVGVAGVGLTACGRADVARSEVAAGVLAEARGIASTDQVLLRSAKLAMFRAQQDGYIDQVRAAMVDAKRRGDIGEADALRADIGDAQIATMDEWPVMKSRLDRDLDTALSRRSAFIGSVAGPRVTATRR